MGTIDIYCRTFSLQVARSSTLRSLLSSFRFFFLTDLLSFLEPSSLFLLFSFVDRSLISSSPVIDWVSLVLSLVLCILPATVHSPSNNLLTLRDSSLRLTSSEVDGCRYDSDVVLFDTDWVNLRLVSRWGMSSLLLMGSRLVFLEQMIINRMGEKKGRRRRQSDSIDDWTEWRTVRRVNGKEFVQNHNWILFSWLKCKWILCLITGNSSCRGSRERWIDGRIRWDQTGRSRT